MERQKRLRQISERITRLMAAYRNAKGFRAERKAHDILQRTLERYPTMEHTRSVYAKRRKNPSRRGRRNPEGSSRNEVIELESFIENDRLLYQNQARYIMVNLAKKMAKGAYDPKKAVKLWGYLADAGAQRYAKEFPGHYAHGSYGPFSPGVRREVAKELALNYDGETKELYRKLKKGEKRHMTKNPSQKIPKRKFKYGDSVSVWNGLRRGRIYLLGPWDDFARVWRYKVEVQGSGQKWVNENSLRKIKK